MKFARLIVLAFTAAAGSLSAQTTQTIEFVTVTWQKSVDQKNATNVADAGTTPYSFRAGVSGTNANPVTGSTFTSVTLGRTTGNVGPSLTFVANDKEWQFQSSYADQASMMSAYPSSGTYTYAMNLYGAAATNASGDTSVAFPAIPDLATSILQSPIVTLTNGTWQGNGTFLVTNVSSAVTLTFNTPYNTTPGTQSFHYDVWLSNGASLSGGLTEGFVNRDAKTGASVSTTVPTLTIAAGQLVDGNSYTLEIGYEQVMASTAILGGTAFSVGLVGVRSKITIATPLSAVPEPATHALGLGMGVLGFIFLNRRQRTSRPARKAGGS